MLFVIYACLLQCLVRFGLLMENAPYFCVHRTYSNKEYGQQSEFNAFFISGASGRIQFKICLEWMVWSPRMLLRVVLAGQLLIAVQGSTDAAVCYPNRAFIDGQLNK